MSKIDWTATKKKDLEVYNLLVSRIDEHTALGTPALAETYQATMDALMEVWTVRYGVDLWAIKKNNPTR